MQEAGKASHSFLSANTPLGFVSRLEQLYNAKDGWKAYILKGGSGGGISYFLEKTGKSMQALGLDTEYIHSAWDCGSYEGIAVPALKICAVDGTPPHCIDPKYPVAVESVINLGECWDEGKLAAESEKIILFSARINACYERACRFLSAAGSLLSDTCRLALDCTDTTKIERYALRIARREFTPKRRQGRESVRFLSGITPDGVICFKDPVETADRAFIIEDDFGVGRLILGKLRLFALNSGYDVVSCYCPMFPSEKIEHLIIPSLSLVFATSNHFHSFTGKGYRHIHIRRFMDNEALRLRRQRLLFNKKSARELIGESVKLLGEAKANNDVLKEIYASAMNLDTADALSAKLIEKITRK